MQRAAAECISSRAADLSLAWTGTTPGQVVAILNQPGEGTASTTLTCVFAGDATEGALPTAGLAELANGRAVLSIFSQNPEIVDEGGWEVTVLTQSLGVLPDGSGATTAVTLVD